MVKLISSRIFFLFKSNIQTYKNSQYSETNNSFLLHLRSALSEGIMHAIYDAAVQVDRD